MNESQEARAIAALTWMTTHFKYEQERHRHEMEQAGHILVGLYSPELQDAIDLLGELKS